jgi:drug/metabolite transporter (DMT)-like permease
MTPIKSPIFLLLLTGLFLGLTFPLGKMASNAGVSPIVWAWLISAGSGVCLFGLHAMSKRLLSLQPHFVIFYICASVVSLVLPNILTFTVIPKLGAGFTGLLFTLSPVFTLAISSVWNVRVPNTLGIVGITLGFLGAGIVGWTKGDITQPASLFWVGVGLCIPLSLAIGNVYRTLAWPAGAQPLELAVGSNLSAGLILTLIILIHPGVELPGKLLTIDEIAILAVLASTAMFTLFFRLQEVGGPTYLSQIGYVAAAVALFSGTVFLSEKYSMMTWIGAAIIVLGVLTSIRAQQRST